MTFHTESDWTLVLKYKEGDDNSIIELFDRMKDYLYGWCYNILRNSADTKDCLQIAAQKFVEASVEKRKSNYFTEGEPKMYAFLKTVFQNTAKDWLRNYRNTTIEVSETIRSNDKLIDEEFDAEELQIAILSLNQENQIFTNAWLLNPGDKKQIMKDLNLSDSEYRYKYERMKLLLFKEIIKLRNQN